MKKHQVSLEDEFFNKKIILAPDDFEDDGIEEEILTPIIEYDVAEREIGRSLQEKYSRENWMYEKW